MKSTRNFFKTVIRITILSQDGPVELDTLKALNEVASENGDCSSAIDTVSRDKIEPEEIVKLLVEQCSTPSLFNLDKDGNELEDYVKDA